VAIPSSSPVRSDPKQTRSQKHFRPRRAGFAVGGVMAEPRAFRAAALECVRVTDGAPPYPAAALLANAPPDELARALAGELDEGGNVTGLFNPFLIRSADAVVLVDTGIGCFAPGPGGRTAA
jgi:hypothetical protein